MINSSSDKISDVKNRVDQYHSVEFSIKGLGLPHQFRIWDSFSGSMSVLIREDSSTLPLLKVGDTLDTKYYSVNSIYPSENMRTLIRHITKKSEGRLRGHYLVGLKILGA
ncbi:hypothetical protein ACFL0H_02355 [Thermodesulfobacteriota bacterium]